MKENKKAKVNLRHHVEEPISLSLIQNFALKMEGVVSWSECPESGCSQVTRETTCANHAKEINLSWAQAMPCPQCEQVLSFLILS